MDKKEAILAETLYKMSIIFADAAKKLAAESNPEQMVKQEEIEAKEPAKEPEVPKEEAAVQKKAEYKLEDVRKILTDVKKKGFGPQIKAIINDHGASNLTKLDSSEYAAVIEEVEALYA